MKIDIYFFERRVRSLGLVLSVLHPLKTISVAYPIRSVPRDLQQLTVASVSEKHWSLFLTICESGSYFVFFIIDLIEIFFRE